MRLYLAVAVLMLAFVAYTEAQEQTFEERLSSFGEKVAALGRTVAERTQAGLQQISDSEFATNTKAWFNDAFSKIREGLDNIGN